MVLIVLSPPKNCLLIIHQTQEPRDHRPGEHNIHISFRTAKKDFIIHDSCEIRNWKGVQLYRGTIFSCRERKPAQLSRAGTFYLVSFDLLSFRRKNLTNACWRYCISTYHRRIQASYRNLRTLISEDFPWYWCSCNPTNFNARSTISQLMSIESDIIVMALKISVIYRARVKARVRGFYDHEMQKWQTEWYRGIGVLTAYAFVSDKSKGMAVSADGPWYTTAGTL